MSGIEVLGVDNVMLGVGDLERARAFYEGVLGLPVKFAFPQAGIVGYRLGAEEPGLLLRARAMEEAAPREINTGWVVEVADPWGNVLGLTDYVKEPARGRTGAAPPA